MAEGSADGWFIYSPWGWRGPLSLEELRAQAAQGSLNREDRVALLGHDEDRKAGEIEGLFANLPPPLTQPGAAPQPMPVPRGNWIMRHWRGQLSLPVSYWLNGLLGGGAVFGTVIAVTSIAGALGRPALLLPAIMILVGWGATVLVAIWHAVGAARSATRVMRETRRRLWPVLTLIALALGLAGLARNLSQDAWPQVTDSWSLLNADANYGPRGMRILRGGREIEFSGPFALGGEEMFREALARAPEAKVVHLDSPGGRLGVAEGVAAQIRARGLDTYVERDCASACTMVFMAGAHRWLKPGALVGFHQGSFGGVSSLIVSGPLRRAYTAASLPAAFIDHALSTPPAKIWNPTTKELLAAHVATGLAPPGMFGRAGFGPTPTEAHADELLDHSALARALAKADPAMWEGIRDEWRTVVLKGLPDSAFDALYRRTLHDTVSRMLPIGEPTAILEVADVLADELVMLQADDPELCWRFLRANGGAEAAQHFSRDLGARDDRTTARLIAETLATPAPRTTPERGRALFAQIEAKARNVRPENDGILAGNRAGAPHDKVCPALKLLLDTARGLPEADAAAFYRFMLAGGR